jgi:hypothetical protein
MKTSLALVAMTVLVVAISLKVRFWEYASSDYISQEVLDLATPVSATIDVDFLQSLVPAYEQ